MSYGNLDFKHLYEFISDLNERSKEAVQKATFHHVARVGKVSSGRVVSTKLDQTIVSLVWSRNAHKTFEDALEKLKVRMHYEKKG